MNRVIILGRITKLELKEKELYLTIAVNKYFRNEKGEYENNLIPCLLRGSIATTTQEHCSKGDFIGINGSLESKEDKLYVLVDKVSLTRSEASS